MLRRTRTRRAGKAVRITLMVVFTGLLISVIIVFNKYQSIFSSNVNLEEEHVYLYIPTGSTYDEVWSKIDQMNFLEDKKSFRWVAEKKEYTENVKPGRYKVVDGMSNNELVNMLRAGNQAPVMVVFNNHRTFNALAGKVSNYLEADSAKILAHLLDPALPEKYGFTKETFMAMFIPNTYEMYWSSSPMDFTNRMAREYDKFWEKRDRKREKMGFSRVDVSTLASIVDEETLFDDENAKVAGVYINRLEQGIPLQACPTLKFAHNDFTIKRVLYVHQQIDSPYNTYKHKGLPPGPIVIPSVSAIDGVLNYEKHNYLYMAAKADFSGYHAFARTLKQHNRNAQEYQRELNKRGIYK